MIYFVPTILFLFYIFIDTLNYFLKTKICKLSFFCIGVALVQLFLGGLTLSKINIDIYRPIAYSVISILFFIAILYILLTTLKLRNNRNTIVRGENNISIIQKIIEWLVILILFSLIFFIPKYNISDLIYYVSISQNFRGGIYSPTGNFNDVTIATYLLPQSYYLYAILFKNIYMAFFIMNSVFYLFLIFSTISIINEYYFSLNNKKYRTVFYQISLLFGAAIFLSNFFLIFGGNLAIQIFGVLTFFLITFFKKHSPYVYFFPFTFLFFSSTAFVTYIFLITSYFFYKLFVGREFNFYSKYLFLIIFYFVITIVFYVSINNNLIIIYFLGLVLSLIINAFIYFIFKNKNFKLKKILEIDISKKYFSILIILLLLLFLNLFVYHIVPILFHDKSNVEKNYSIYDFLVIFIITFFLIFYLLISWKNNNKNINIIYIFIVFWSINITVSLLTYLPISYFKRLQENESYWRSIWTFIGINLRSEILIILLPIFLETSKFIKIDFRNSYKIIALFILSFFSLFNFFPIISNLKLFDSKIDKNIKLLSDNEIEAIKKLDFGDYQKSYLTMLPLTCYINKGLNVDNWINFDNKLSWVTWWMAIQNFHNFEKVISKENFLLEINRLNNYARTTGFRNFNNKIVNQINYIFLVNNQNRFFYINGLKGIYHETYINVDIIIMQLDDNQVG
ncbi:MAG: hypothetical protein ACRDCG_01605 [Mycoplasmoidaceae bacterium]